jgi:hypothetical protein
MTVLKVTLDHVGVAVRDLAQAYAAYTALGFSLTPLSVHSGKSPSGEVQPFGSANHCAMLKMGYLELIGIVDPSRPSSVAPFLKSRHGGFITALGCNDADEAYRRARQHFESAQRPVLLQRPVDTLTGEPAMAQFHNMLLGDAFPESRVLMIEHLTRHLLWRPDHMSHTNGVTAIVGAEFLVQNPSEAAERYGKLAQVSPEALSSGDFRLRLDGQELRFCSQSAAQAAGFHCPSLFGALFQVADIASTARLLTQNGVPFTRTPHGSLRVPPEYGCGFSVTFIA